VKPKLWHYFCDLISLNLIMSKGATRGGEAKEVEALLSQVQVMKKDKQF